MHDTSIIFKVLLAEQCVTVMACESIRKNFAGQFALDHPAHEHAHFRAPPEQHSASTADHGYIIL